MSNSLKICVTVILFGMTSVSYAGFMDTDPSNLIKAYIDASVDNLKPILGSHKNHSYGQYDGVKCYEQLKYFKDEAKETKFWTLKVLDSWSKIPSGLMFGNIRDLGHFDQCLAIEQNSGISTVGTFRGQYCLTLLAPMKDKTISTDNEMSSMINSASSQISPYLATCIPDTCSPDAWENVVNLLVNKYHVKVTRPLHNFCQSAQTKIPMSNLDIFALIFFTTIIILMIASTCAEYILINSDVDPSTSIWTIFSIYSNGKEIFKIESIKPGSNTVECINGLRTFSSFWIILLHSYLALDKQPIINPLVIIEWSETMFANLAVQSNFAVDTFFVIGGFVLCWNRLRYLDKSNGKINFILLIIKRYVQVIPSLMASILFMVTLMKYIGKGPIWKDVLIERIEICENYWLNTMLLIQNYTSCCMEESWYLAVDFHLFFVSLFLIYGIWKFGKKFAWIILLPVLFAIGFQFYTIVVNNFEPGNMTVNRFHSYFNDVYKATHMRMGSYFIGILLALFMYNNRDKKFKWSKLKIICMWMLSNIAFWISYFCIDNSIHNPTGTYRFALYNVTLRPLWALNIVWIIFACHHGKGGIINQFLSYRIWQPTARLSFYIYIIHPYVILYFNARSHTPFYYDDLFMLRRYFGDVMVTVIVSIFCSLAFGSPFNRLLNHITMPRKEVIDNSIEHGCTEETENKKRNV